LKLNKLYAIHSFCRSECLDRAFARHKDGHSLDAMRSRLINNAVRNGVFSGDRTLDLG